MGNQKILIRIVLIGALWVTALVQMLADQLFADNNQIITAFASTNAQLAESRIEITTQWKDGQLIDEEDKEKLLIKFAQMIGFDGTYNIINEKRNKQNISYIKINQEDVEAVIEVISELETGKEYGYMELNISDQMQDILVYKNQIEKVCKELGAKKYQTILKFYGEYPGQLSNEKQNQEIKHLFHNLDAKVVSEINEEGIYTVYGYTKIVKDYMQVFRHRINLNVAFSYNEETNVTRLYLATPIISDDY